MVTKIVSDARQALETQEAEAQEADPKEQPFQIEYARPDKSVKPLYLFADSQLLFWKNGGMALMDTIRARLGKSHPVAAYIGAANGDDPAYYSIFEAAMDEAGIEDRGMVPSDPQAKDLDLVDRADLILLSGGDVELGWRTFESNGLKQILVRRYYEGALLIGVSAGAVHLGLGGWGAQGPEGGSLIDTLRIIPHVVGAHEEAVEWAPLKAAVARLGEHVRGYGIPFGGGFVYHPDHTIEPLRRPLVELRLKGKEVRQSMLLPGQEKELKDEEGAVN